MSKNGLVGILVTSLFCASIFLGCATVPKEELAEKDAIIQNLNSQIDSLKQEVKRLTQENEELMDIRTQLERKLKEETQKQKPVIEEKSEVKVK